MDLLRQGEFDVLLPSSDYTLLALCRIRREVESHVSLPLAENAAIAHAQDKLQTLALARELGITISETPVPENARELEQRAAKIS
jgi:glutathione synthase/RimK-type ligase-like ATP-grasp enzyme